MPPNIFLQYIAIRHKSLTPIYCLHFHFLILEKLRSWKHECKIYFGGNITYFIERTQFLQNMNYHRNPLPRHLLKYIRCDLINLLIKEHFINNLSGTCISQSAVPHHCGLTHTHKNQNCNCHRKSLLKSGNIWKTLE